MIAFKICPWLWTAWVAIWVLWAFQSKRTQQREGLTSQIAYRIPILAAACLIGAGKYLSPWWTSNIVPYRDWFGWLGLAITILGFALTIWARAILGGNWSGEVTIKVDHELIRTGPYRIVRHPIYTGILMAFTGSALLYDQWRGFVVVILFWIAFTIKRLKEEQFMRQTFGDQYVEYTRTTGAIFPTLVRRSS
jgi:protein-S-isoprenylcysteine O-methyltransferase Ste14